MREEPFQARAMARAEAVGISSTAERDPGGRSVRRLGEQGRAGRTRARRLVGLTIT